MDVRTDGDIADNFWWRRTTLTRRTPLYDACVSVGLLVAATIVGALLDHPGLAPSIMIVYVFAVQLCAFFTWSRLYCLLSSAAAVALYNFLFVDPRYSLSLIDRVYPGMFFIMFVVSLVSSSIALALRRALAQAAASDRRTHMVLETNRMLQRCADQQQIVHAMATQLARLSGCPVVWYSADADDDDLLPRATYTAVGDAAPVHELAPQMPPRLSASAYVGTPLDATFGGSAFYGIYLTVRTGDGFVRSGDPASVVGVLAIVAEPDVLTHEERTLADAIVSEGELALDRARAMEAREEAAVLAKNEQLRANLLRSISHDLRTPLTSISGNALILTEKNPLLTEEKRRELSAAIYEDANWLNHLVENLLSITRMENGQVNLHIQPELIQDIFDDVLAHLDHDAARHTIVTNVADDLLMADMDAQLIEQVLVNLINNAIKYTPEHSRIELFAAPEGKFVRICVTDDGPGIPEESQDKLFDMFYTLGKTRSDGRRGLGLGLALCRSIVAAHGGVIDVQNAAPHGACFRFTLPRTEVTLYE